MSDYSWSGLTKLQLGKYAEYFVKMEMVHAKWDVYSPEVDDKAIDFIATRDYTRYLRIQVKSIRKRGYVFVEKSKFKPHPDLYLALVVFLESEAPHRFLIPSTAWQDPVPPLVDQTYEGKKSPPEWGINISSKHWGALGQYDMDKVVASNRGRS